MSLNFKDRKSEHGFTLVELIIVVVILALITAALGWKFLGGVDPSKEKIAQIAIADIEGQLLLYNTEVGSYPSESEGLELLLGTSGDSPRYLKKIPIDPWGNPYVYRFPSQNGLDFDLCSNGIDGDEGTDDDICNWK